MHVRIEELLRYLDSTRADLRRAVEEVPAAQRRVRPAEDRWSVAEVLEHLALVEPRITEVVAARLAAAREAGLGAETATGSVLDPAVLERLRDRGRPVTASETVRPPGVRDAGAALAGLEAARAVLRDVVVSADGLALGEVVLPHPVLGPLDLYGWIVFIGGHEARHTAQIREIGGAGG
ncbi:MAG TPA: DinB family protein [Longimicrobiales bacterium]|nr:DinB family protein [Longimicrobiales bacterium]